MSRSIVSRAAFPHPCTNKESPSLCLLRAVPRRLWHPASSVRKRKASYLRSNPVQSVGHALAPLAPTSPSPSPNRSPPPSLLARRNRRARLHPRRRTSDETKPSTSPSSSRDAATLASRTCDPGESCARLPTPHPLSPSPVPPTLVVKPQPSLDRALGARLRRPHPNPPPADNPSSQSSIFLIKQCVKTQFCYCFDDNT